MDDIRKLMNVGKYLKISFSDSIYRCLSWILHFSCKVVQIAFAQTVEKQIQFELRHGEMKNEVSEEVKLTWKTMYFKQMFHIDALVQKSFIISWLILRHFHLKTHFNAHVKMFLPSHVQPSWLKEITIFPWNKLESVKFNLLLAGLITKLLNNRLGFYENCCFEDTKQDERRLAFLSRCILFV